MAAVAAIVLIGKPARDSAGWFWARVAHGLFPLDRKVTPTNRAGQTTERTLKVLGRMEEVAFGGGRAVPWAGLAGPDAAVLAIWRDRDDQTTHSRGDPWRAELPTIGIEVDLAEADRTVPGYDCAYSGPNRVSSVRRVYRATAFEAAPGVASASASSKAPRPNAP